DFSLPGFAPPLGRTFCSRRAKFQWFATFLLRSCRMGSDATASGDNAMKSAIIKRSIVISGQKTSVSLEDAFWIALKEMAAGRRMTLSELVARIDGDRKNGNLSSAIRLFVLGCYREQIEQLQGAARKALTPAAA